MNASLLINETAAAWCGLDVAKDNFQAAIYLPQPPGEIPRSVASLPIHQFARSPQGVAQWLAWSDRQLAEHARRQGLDQPPCLRACMEATGRYSLELAAWIAQTREPIQPAIIDPLAASHYAKSLRMRNKTDRVDAAVLARMGYERRFAPTDRCTALEPGPGCCPGSRTSPPSRGTRPRRAGCG